MCHQIFPISSSIHNSLHIIVSITLIHIFFVFLICIFGSQAVAQGQSAGLVETKIRDSTEFVVSVNLEAGFVAVFSLTYEEMLQRVHDMYELVLNICPGQIVDDLNVEVMKLELGYFFNILDILEIFCTMLFFNFTNCLPLTRTTYFELSNLRLLNWQRKNCCIYVLLLINFLPYFPIF